MNGKLYLAGGSAEGPDGFAPDPSIEVYDPATATWDVLIEELPIAPDHLRLIRFRDRLLIYSAQDSEDKDVVSILLTQPLAPADDVAVTEADAN